jgi:hypothetical protein
MIENVSQHNIFRFEFHGYYGTVLTGMEICKYNIYVTFASAISLLYLCILKNMINICGSGSGSCLSTFELERKLV